MRIFLLCVWIKSIDNTRLNAKWGRANSVTVYLCAAHRIEKMKCIFGCVMMNHIELYSIFSCPSPKFVTIFPHFQQFIRPHLTRIRSELNLIQSFCFYFICIRIINYISFAHSSRSRYNASNNNLIKNIQHWI